MEGTVDKIKGTVKEVAGKVTGNERLEAEGKADQVKGDVKNTAEKVTDTAKGVGDSLRKENTPR
jgi:uncharacterized protein YjbJ (UPF0337 family)